MADPFPEPVPERSRRVSRSGVEAKEYSGLKILILEPALRVSDLVYSRFCKKEAKIMTKVEPTRVIYSVCTIWNKSEKMPSLFSEKPRRGRNIQAQGEAL